MRRDHPDLHDRADHDAHARSMLADPRAILDALKASHDEMLSNGGKQDLK